MVGVLKLASGLSRRIGTRTRLLETLSLCFQYAEDFPREFVEFLRILLNGSLFAKLAPEFLFLLAHSSSQSLQGRSAVVCCRSGAPSVDWLS